MLNFDESQIFEVSISGAPRRYDPLEVDARLYESAAGEDVPALLGRIFPGPDVEQSEGAWLDAAVKMAPHFAAAFRVKAFDGESGLPVAALVGLYGEFLAWCADLKKNTDTSQSLSPATDSLPDGKSDGSSSSGSI